MVWIQHGLATHTHTKIWVCLKMGYTPSYSHLIGIMIINHWNLLGVGVHYFQTHPYVYLRWVWVNTYRYIFSGMNIHLPAILGFTRYQGFDPSPDGSKSVWFWKKFFALLWMVCVFPGTGYSSQVSSDLAWYTRTNHGSDIQMSGSSMGIPWEYHGAFWCLNHLLLSQLLPTVPWTMNMRHILVGLHVTHFTWCCFSATHECF